MVQAFGAAGLLGDSSGLATLKQGNFAKLGTQLAALLVEEQGVTSPAVARFARPELTGSGADLISSVQHFSGAVTLGADGTRYVVIDATARDGNGAALLSELEGLGLKSGASFGGMASGYLPTAQLGALAAITNLQGANESAFTTSAGLVTSQADVAQRADLARASFGVDGTGLKVGVLSDSFNTSAAATSGKDDVAANIASGDLPSQVKILEDLPDGSDEGRAMAQLIHDIAPGAAIDFATAYGGQAGFANNILRLAADGAKVIVDDVIYYGEPAYQDGVIAQAVDAVVAQGVSYFSSAGNNGAEGYEQRWVGGSSDVDYQYMEFAPGQEGLPFVASGYPDVFVMQWDQPSASAGGAGSASDLDILVVDGDGKVVAGGGANNIKSGDPQEAFQFEGKAGEVYYLVVGLYAGPAPNYVKIMALGNGSGVDLGTTERNINNGTSYGHSTAEGAVGVGAAFYYDTPAYGSSPLVEDYSSLGPVRILFDAAGNRLASPVIRNSTDLTAADGGNTTFFGSDVAARYADEDTYPNFFGTSAAAPNAAAVALLMLQANSALTTTDITALLRNSAVDMDNPYTNGFDIGDDQATGAGFIQADLAVRYATTGIIDNEAATLLTGTHLDDVIIGGTGNNVVRGMDGDDVVIGGAGNDTLSGGAGADLFRFDSAGASGIDRITDFGPRDAIATTKAIKDGNGDGIITFGRDGVLNLESGRNGDQLTLDGVDFARGLRFLGSVGGEFYYAEAGVRPSAVAGQKVVEGTVASDSLTLSKTGSHVLFVDNGGAAPIGTDRVTGFSAKDILVTTEQLPDGNDDGVISFARNKVLDLGDGDTLSLRDSGNKAITSLEFDGSTTHDGVTYYVYSRVGSTAGVADLHF